MVLLVMTLSAFPAYFQFFDEGSRLLVKRSVKLASHLQIIEEWRDIAVRFDYSSTPPTLIAPALMREYRMNSEQKSATMPPQTTPS